MKKIAIEAARKAGAVLKKQFGNLKSKRQKGRKTREFVTQADLEAEAAILKIILKKFPRHDIMAEESGAKDNPGKTLWVIDPLDGTTNFFYGIPHFCVSIAVVENKQPFLGVVYDPLREELFIAEKGKGATMNGKKISVTRNERMKDALVATGFPYEDDHLMRQLRYFQNMCPRVRGTRRAGSAALDLTYVACGRLDAYWELDIHPWDIAAGILLVREAGGRVTNVAGKPWRLGDAEPLASNGLIHRSLLNIFR